MQEEQK
jgi:hypothetical protein